MPIGKKFNWILSIISVITITGLLGACSEQVDSPAFAALAVKDQVVAGTNSQSGIEVEVEGIVQALSATSITINGQTFTFDSAVVAQNGVTLQVGAQAKVRGLLADNQVQVTQIVPGRLEDNTPTPSVTATVTATITAGPTVTQGDDNRRGRGNDDPPGDDRGRGQGNDDPPGDNRGQGNDDNTVTPTPRPNVVPTTTVKATPTAQDNRGSNNGGGDNRGKGDDKNKATATPRPTNPPSATPTPRASDDKGGDNRGKGGGGNNGGSDDKGGNSGKGGGKGK